MNIEEAKNIKLAVAQLHDTNHGKALLEYLGDRAGYFAPTYDSTNPTSITLAAGRTEMIMFIRNLNRLTEEQIVELCKQEGT